MIGFTIEVEGLREMRRDVRRLGNALDAAVERAVRDTARAVVAEAKRTHDYVDRTWHLTRSNTTYDPTGRFTEDTLEGLVVNTARYASYIHDGTTRGIRPYLFLGNAWVAQYFDTEERMRDALDDAVRRAGF